jgi:hypothetical protein
MLLRKIIVFLFIKTINPRIKIKYDENDFAFCFKNNTLYYNFNLIDMGFLRHMRECHKREPQFGLMLYSLLHELGHYYMQDCISEDEIETRAYCALLPVDFVLERPEIQNLYFNLESEFEATEWAIQYTIKHNRKCKIFNHLIGG